MGEYAEDVLSGLRDEETGVIIDGKAPGYPRKLAERPTNLDRPLRDMPCIVPGCPKKFRRSTQYEDFVVHYERRHGSKP